MDLNHLHIHVRDLERSRRFYSDYFEFAEAIRIADGPLFLNNRDGFNLALVEDPSPQALPQWFHFGFRLPAREDVKALLARMERDGVPVPKGLYEDEDYTTFRCLDPDGYSIEVFWE